MRDQKDAVTKNLRRERYGPQDTLMESPGRELREGVGWDILLLES